MDLTKINIHEMLNMLFQKVSEIFNITNLSKIDWSNITSAIITTIIVILTSSIILWLLKAIGLYTIAKKNGDKDAYIAFIPYGCLYTMGKIVNQTKIFGIEINNAQWLLPLLAISVMLPMVGWLASILLILFYYAVLYRIYQKQVPNVAIILTILSIILPILIPFFLFFIRNKN